ncbi:MAG TPA: bifunctional diaminohydroxyphosphoribosylaminopyrimidine deaminase/5-amino-6-(5-phosphoribosylamino)uracil reductase RibD [Rudaea sp.]|jgi:diaminohydroxyphosphoribosylaminopyrimidine deaminase/5-amino-6-(5-phosphoribosylamino)uracil reductase|nr:bifunctional diaminohydroxyphosphoribosylaminopyrimidine deaminase/5-amino-6-(5-phosphoribosylamino)uracil reductase RibD [Rudaea sp.]
MTDFSAADHAHMARALRLAERGLFTTQPNPRVGCVIARGDEVIAEGWHQRAGEPHAEVFALRDAGERARAATAYVTLEPCAHFGKTPPCADALIASGISRVVAACEDPNPRVAGGGFRKLRDVGIAVDIGLMRDAARELNRGFLSRLERKRPWVRVKLASSLDGRTALANGESKWITSEASRADVQRWRARSSAILTAIGTVLADDPRLTVRLDESFVAPLRVVLDRTLRTPRDAHVLDGTAPTLIVHGADAKPDERFSNVELAAIPASNGKLYFDALLILLAERGVNELQVEAGPKLCGSLMADGLVDELLLYTAPVLLGDTSRPLLTLPECSSMNDARRWKIVDRRHIGEDTRLLLRP